ncbi:HD domain-containing protein [Roseovarius lutimaris]|uniref:HD domain-containing protein n=2 Tax=Roseovarius lutimaris TaxID=1005928 RepID=A0A1I5GR54_9RHOB|nr:HD domain-containing protein [Roseovarius lutimaris]
MMLFDGSSMRLIDSPILQRMRRVRQLGFSFLTYPSAEHSRFPHSIGMAHVVSRFVDAIDRKRSPSEMQDGLDGYKTFADLSPLTREEMIHAAIMHDVGHLPFSHALESAIIASKERFEFGGCSYQDFKDLAEYKLKAEISLSEALSLAVVLSPRFGSYYSNYVRSQPDEDAQFRLACLIAGQRVSDKCGNIQDIISSSSVDADKIDYVNRDAEACGIPIGVDVSRVFLGSSMIGLQDWKAKELGYGGGDRMVFALNASGWDTYDEIIRARSVLYQRVYLHAVTRTSEAIVARALKLNSQYSLETGTGADARYKDAVFLWSHTDESFLTGLSGVENKEISQLALSIMRRTLPKKACALGAVILERQIPIGSILPRLFGPKSGSDSEATLDKTVSSPFQDLFTRGGDDLIDSVDFENQIRSEVESISAKIREVEAGRGNKNKKERSLIPEGEPPQVFFIAIAALDQKLIEAPVFQHGELLTADNFTNVRGVSDAGDFFRQIGFIMAASEWREVVCLATRSVVFRRSEQFSRASISIKGDSEFSLTKSPQEFSVYPLSIVNLDAVTRRTSINVKRLNRINDTLIAGGYYDHVPLLAPKFDSEEAASAAEKYGKFNGEGGWTIDNETTTAFLNQFPPKLREDMVKLLAEGTFLDRNEVLTKVRIAIDNLKSRVAGRSYLVPLSASSGGETWSVAMKEFASDDKLSAEASLSSALRSCGPDDQIIFVDDNAASGTQSCAQLYSYCVANKDEWPEEYRKENALFGLLSEEEIKQFKTVPIGIAVAVGHQTAHERLEATCSDLGISHFSGIEYAEQIGEKVHIPTELKEFLLSVGKQLFALDRYQTKFDDLSSEKRAKCQEYGLGYSGFCGLTILASNVPTSTLTPIWMPGIVNGRPWQPLAIRWGRLRNLTLA